jgi:hypothetical protein
VGAALMRRRALGCGLILLLLCGAPALALALPALLPRAERVPPVVLNDLLVDASAFPGEWGVGEGPGRARPPRDLSLGEDGAVIWLVPRGRLAFAHQQVMRFRNATAAVYGFQQLRYFSGIFPDDPRVPPGWSYRSPSAGDWTFACANDGARVAWCLAIARYDEFVSVFVAHGEPDGLALAEMERVLRAIDARMDAQLRR